MNTQTPILICGPTVSGKSALAMAVAQRVDGVIINADALQVYENWRLLTARPSIEDENLVEHRLYGHVNKDVTYSVGAWLRDIKPVLAGPKRAIIVGGTGLYFTSLTNGLAEIPETPSDVRALGDDIRMQADNALFVAYLQTHDPEILVNMDVNNPMRLQRAWEVHKATGRGLSAWQKDTGTPLVSREGSLRYSLISNTNWLNSRIERRFEKMVEHGALVECQSALNDGWNPSLPSSRALGAAELIAHLNGEMSLTDACERAAIITRQFAKRQRTWFRSKMADWVQQPLDDSTDINKLADQISR